MVTRSSNAKPSKTDPLADAVGAAAGAMLASRPKLTPQDIFAALLGAYATTTGATPAPAVIVAPHPATKAARCPTCKGRRPVAPGRKYCGPCLQAGAKRKRPWTAARRAKKAARVTPISSARKKAKQPKSWRKSRAPARVAPAKPKRFTKAVRESFDGGKKEFVAALDRSNGGLVSRYIEMLDDNSPILKSLSDEVSRPQRWRFKTWTDAVEWVLPKRSHRWDAVDARRLRTVSDAMKEALTVSAGGMTDLTRAGLAFVDLRLPDETEAILERQRQAEGYFDERARGTG